MSLHSSKTSDKAWRRSFIPTPIIIEDSDMLNNWVNFYSPDVEKVRYWKTPDNIIHIEGLLKDGTVGSPAFILPAGYRPPVERIISTTANSAFAQMTVKTDGNVRPHTGVNTPWFSLDGISFRAA
jgi:hypothetical protein